MPAPSVVTFPNIIGSLRRVIYEVVQPFFNGGSHTVGGVSVVFPIAKVVFETTRIDIAGPAIVFDLISSSEQDLKCEDPYHPNNAAGFGVEKRSSVLANILVTTPQDQGATSKNQETIDIIWSCLVALMGAKAAVWSARNVRRTWLESIPVVIPNKDFSAVSGVLRIQTAVKFKKDAN